MVSCIYAVGRGLNIVYSSVECARSVDCSLRVCITHTFSCESNQCLGSSVSRGICFRRLIPRPILAHSSRGLSLRSSALVVGMLVAAVPPYWLLFLRGYVL